jgi:hypothetical protein
MSISSLGFAIHCTGSVLSTLTFGPVGSLVYFVFWVSWEHTAQRQHAAYCKRVQEALYGRL